MLDFMQNYDRKGMKVNPEFENMSIEDILSSKDMAFGVSLVPTVYYNPFKDNGPDNPQGGYEISKANSVVRTDTFEELGTGFSANYVPVSYLDALEGIFGDLRNLGGIPTRLVKMNNGAKIAMQFVLPENYYVGDMLHKQFANLYTSHDGTQGIQINSSDIAIVCWNTYAASLADKTLKYSARHTLNVTKRMNEIRQTVFTFQKYQELHTQFLNAALLREVNSAEVTQFIQAIFPEKEKNENIRKNSATENRRAELNTAIAISLNERNSSNVTAYDLFQGITRYNTYRQAANRTEDEQFEYVMENPEAQKKANTAVNFIRELV